MSSYKEFKSDVTGLVFSILAVAVILFLFKVVFLATFLILFGLSIPVLRLINGGKNKQKEDAFRIGLIVGMVIFVFIIIGWGFFSFLSALWSY